MSRDVPQTTNARPGSASQGTFGALSRGTYVLVTTTKRDGTAVPTPVHLVAEPEGETAYFRTWATSGKAKRLRHTPQITLAPSTARGKEAGPGIQAEALLASGVDAARAAELLAAKHPFAHGFFIPRIPDKLRHWETVHYVVRAAGGDALGDALGDAGGAQGE